MSLGGEWSVALVEGIKGYLRVDGQYVGSAPASYTNRSSDYVRPSYTTVNASLGSHIRNFEVTVYASNLLNRPQVVDIVEQNNGGPLWVVAPPRTVGATVRYHFR
jgi:outer membrane receptor protein involved in Fe transport